jgi:hypothetical protein
LRAYAQLPKRYGPQQLERDAHDAQVRLRLESFELAGEQRGGRAAVLGVRVPGAAGELGGVVGAWAEAVEDRVWHGEGG